MKTIIITFVLYWGAMLTIFTGCYKPTAKPVYVKLPTGWKTISADKNDPELLVAHLVGDTLFLRFDN